MPTFGLKLLSTITECNLAFVGVIYKLKLIGHLLDYYSGTGLHHLVVGHARLNIHTVKLVKSIVEYDDIPLEELNTYNVVSKTNDLLNHLIANQQDWCLDSVLDIIFLILQSAFRKLQQSKNASVNSSAISKEGTVGATGAAKVLLTAEGLIDNFEPCMLLLSGPDTTLAEKSAQIVFVLLQLFGTARVPEQRQVYFVEGHVKHLLDALKVDKVSIRKRVLKCLLFALDQEGHPLMLTEEQKSAISAAVQPLAAASSDKSMATVAGKIIALLS